MSIQKFMITLDDELQFDSNDIHNRIKNYGIYTPKSVHVLKLTENFVNKCENPRCNGSVHDNGMGLEVICPMLGVKE